VFCPSLGEIRMWCVCPKVSDIVCELLGVSYFVTDLPVLVKCENPTGDRSWFFTLVGRKVFHVKICVFFIFLIICLLLSQDQSVRSV